MRIVTWNLNSIRARHDRLLALLARHRPDVVCLQELKVEDAAFPYDDLRSAGYRAEILGQRAYNGVAILTREPLEDVRRGMGEGDTDPQARVISGVYRGIRILSAYFPNGGEVGSDKYGYKLAWMKRLRAMLERDFSPSMPLVLAGDFNVAPDERDTKNPEVWRNTVLFTDEVREALRELRSWGLHDSLRLVNDAPGLYSWWDYQLLGFAKNNGLRIDHLDVTAPLCPRVRDVRIDRDERKGKQPSDHAPVLLELVD